MQTKFGMVPLLVHFAISPAAQPLSQQRYCRFMRSPLIHARLLVELLHCWYWWGVASLSLQNFACTGREDDGPASNTFILVSSRCPVLRSPPLPRLLHDKGLSLQLSDAVCLGGIPRSCGSLTCSLWLAPSFLPAPPIAFCGKCFLSKGWVILVCAWIFCTQKLSASCVTVC